MNKLTSTKNPVFIPLAGPSETRKSQPIYKWLKIGTFQPKFDKIYFFYQHPQPLYDVMQKEIENLEFVRGVNFEFIDSLKNNGTKYMLIFDDSCEGICNSKVFVDIAIAGRPWGLSTMYFKLNLFCQSKLGREVELQNNHIVLFHPFSNKSINFFLQPCPKEFIRFFCECIINLLKGNLQSIKRHHVAKFQTEVQLLSLKRTTWKQKRDILASQRGLQLIKVIILPSLTICPDMEQFVFVPASVYSESLITQSVTKQELPKYQPSQTPTYQVDSIRKEINNKLFSQADSLVDKNLSCPRIKLSISQSIIWDGVETGISLLDFAQQKRRKNAELPDI